MSIFVKSCAGAVVGCLAVIASSANAQTGLTFGSQIGLRGLESLRGGAPIQDIYAGSTRLGRLIGLDVTAQCAETIMNEAEFAAAADEIGLMGLVETSTGMLVHLCIGVRFNDGDVGTGFTPMVRNGFQSGQYNRYFKSSNCTGQVYTEAYPIGELSFSFNGIGAPVTGGLGGVFGKLMGRRRVAILPSDLGADAYSSVDRKFMLTGTPEYTQMNSALDVDNSCVTRENSFPQGFVAIFPNDPSVSGLPHRPQTPYTIVDVR